MRSFKNYFWALCLLLGIGTMAQEKGSSGIPKETYYLMPEFTQGTIYFRGQGPAQGTLNICAVDNTLRFLDKSGKEVVAAGAENILRVKIDTVLFMKHEDAYYRMAPVTFDMGVAVLRTVHIIKGEKQGAYGTTSQTSSIKNYGSVYADGILHELESNKHYPYEASEELYLYKGDTVFPLNKKNLKKLFPKKKSEIDAWFKAGNKLPATTPDAVALLAQFNTEE